MFIVSLGQEFRLDQAGSAYFCSISVFQSVPSAERLRLRTGMMWRLVLLHVRQLIIWTGSLSSHPHEPVHVRGTGGRGKRREKARGKVSSLLWPKFRSHTASLLSLFLFNQSLTFKEGETDCLFLWNGKVLMGYMGPEILLWPLEKTICQSVLAAQFTSFPHTEYTHILVPKSPSVIHPFMAYGSSLRFRISLSSGPGAGANSLGTISWRQHLECSSTWFENLGTKETNHLPPSPPLPNIQWWSISLASCSRRGKTGDTEKPLVHNNSFYILPLRTILFL